MRYAVTVTFTISSPDGQPMSGQDLKHEIDWAFPWGYQLVKWEEIPV